MIEPRGRQRERIVDATGRLFSDKGYHGTSMADIGKAVGLEKGSLYTHISAKQEVLRELVERGAAFFMEALAPVAVAPEPAPEKLRRALRAHLGVVAAHPDLATVFLQEWRQLKAPRASASRGCATSTRGCGEASWRRVSPRGRSAAMPIRAWPPCCSCRRAIGPTSGSIPAARFLLML